jgi:glc operon protein GlcG
MKPVLTLELARQMLTACEAKARELGLSLTIAVVDDGGHPIALARMDGIHAATVEIAIAKARSAVLFKRPTAKFGEAMAGGAIGLLALPNVVPFAGGLPLLAGPALVGGIGASGAAAHQDEEVAQAGASILAAALSG